MSAHQPYVVVVILNTNRAADTLSCLASLERSSYKNYKIVVLDNASTDGSAHAIRSAFPMAQVIELAENLGYAGNNNVGIRAALSEGADWVFLLNEDTIVATSALEHLVAVGERDDRIGVVGPTVYHYDEPNIIQSAGGRLGRFWESIHIAQNERDQGRYVVPQQVDWISGCAVMVRRAVVEQVGGLDERFFYYWEETEWCVRAGRAGWRLVHVPAGKIWHKGVQRAYRPGPSVTYYNTRNRLLLLATHDAPLWVRMVVWAQLLRTLTSWTVRPKWRSMHEHRNAMWEGIRDYLGRRWGARPL